MYLFSNEIESCLTKAAEIAEYFQLDHIGSDDPQRSIDNLAATCRKRLNSTIRILKLEVTKAEAAEWGATLMLDDGAEICVVSDLNYCWERFVICKELFHVIIDKEEYRNVNIEQHLRETTVAFPDAESKPDTSVRVEILAEIAAMEFMFPYSCRLQEAQGENKNNYLAIAEKYKVPQLLVEKFMSPDYMENLGEFHAQK